MKKYTVEFQELRTYSVIVTAETETQAINKAKEAEQAACEWMATAYDYYEVVHTEPAETISE